MTGIKEGVEISEGLKYHKEYDLPLVENARRNVCI